MRQSIDQMDCLGGTHACSGDRRQPDNTVHVGGMLRDIGFEVFEAEDGNVALTRLKEIGQPDLVLIDWNMPVMNGYEFVIAVRSDERYNDVPLMMVTTETEMSQVVKALEAGANEYIMKPFTREILLEKLEILGVDVAQEATQEHPCP